jgi:NtrC-family two-component system response regulator AlgB
MNANTLSADRGADIATMNREIPSDSNPRLHVLVVDDEINVRKTLAVSLETDGHRVVAVSNGADALAEAERNHFDVAFVDLRLKNKSGSDLIPELIAKSPWMRIVVITAFATVDSAVETMKRGAVDYITKPFTPRQIKQITDALALRVAPGQATPDANGKPAFSLESNDPVMQRAISLARQVAASDTTVLIRGESGTGKGVLARAIHEWSARADRPFATVSCPALSPQLLESELFGHVRGAFTGAVRDNPGRIAKSDGGTLFLDEIGDLPLDLQPKLLRLVQDKQYESVGESITRHADVRIITATNINLEDAVRAGRFREDLLYRINVISIDVPPLRDRPNDIIPLAERFAVELNRGNPVAGFTDEAVSALRSYTWPGNVRELRNVIERAVVLCQSKQIGLQHLPGSFLPNNAPEMELGDAIPVDKLEEVHIRRVLARSKTLEEAASVLGIDPATLWRRRKKYGI